MQWSIEWLNLELNYTWKIARNSSDFKRNAIITVSMGNWKGIGEVAPNIRYNETPENIQDEFEKFLRAGANDVGDLDELTALLNSVQVPNALRFGIESAYIHMLCHAEKMSIYDFLDLPKPLAAPTSFSLPIMDIGDLKKFYNDNSLHRFKFIKLKVNRDNAIETIREVATFSNQPLIIDANESFTDPDNVISLIEHLKNTRIEFIEQPMPSQLCSEYEYLKSRLNLPIFADESICAEADLGELKKQFHGINMKLMKAGGYLNGMLLICEAKKHGMKTMIGCMVETTLGIASAFYLCHGIDYIDLDGFLIVKDEPFKLIKEVDGELSLNE